MKYLATIVLLCFSFLGFCLTGEDSLVSKLNQAVADSDKVKILIKLSGASIDTEQAMNYANSALAIANKNKHNKFIIDASNNIAGIYYQKGNYLNALFHYYNAIKIIDHDSLFNKTAANIFNSVGIIYFYQANYDKALEYFGRSLKVYENLKDSAGIASAYNNHGIIYNNLNDRDKTLYYHFKSLEINEKIQNKRGMASSYNNIGEIFREQKRFDRALSYYRKSLELKSQIGNEAGMATTYTNLGLVHLAMKDYSLALEFLSKGLQIREKIGDKRETAGSCNTLGDYYLEIKDYNNAVKYYTQGLSLAQEMSVPEVIKDAADGLRKAYSKLGNYKLAYENMELLKQITDTLNNKESLKKITQIEMNREIDKMLQKQVLDDISKEAEYRSEIKQQKVLKNAFLIGFGLMVLLAFVVFRSYKSKKKANVQLNSQKNEIAQEKQKTDDLLLNILPKAIAEELKAKGKASVVQYEKVSVLFADFKGFTQLCEVLPPMDLLKELSYYFSKFDEIIKKYNIEKIKTIGDAYMCAGGVPVANNTNPVEIVLAGLEMQQFMSGVNQWQIERGEPVWQLRIGIHTGTVVAGVVGKYKFAYDIWGDTVNIASRMEEAGAIGKVNISGDTYGFVSEYFNCDYRGKISAKNKGDIDMYFVDSVKEDYSVDQIIKSLNA